MPDEIYGVMAVKNGQKQTIMNLSNARQKSYADLQTNAQKKGVIVCPDYPKEEFLVTADEVSYGSGTVKDALDELGVAWTLDFGAYNNGSYRSKVVRVGNVVFLYFSGAKSLTANTFTRVGTLPNDCPKPSTTQTINLQYSSAYATIGVYSNGNIEVNCNEANCYAMGMMMYTV